MLIKNNKLLKQSNFKLEKDILHIGGVIFEVNQK